ncbi:hypothetical protein LV84_02418 [Algoriphagus ratkowskyi]|uniref:Uncharacterized protein n=1 Tax=Algoriphagus ratkowskyi TaxID=57028 RepID=A0A2W7R7C1_9BACT|nr:hypothetical protein [Algoriphagus ratkowskyi]PZX56051.1 hypothetical protein LV84_02418 [Algoriphagus ratkowskyi]TXD77142.1 hypothetical protein ESW18_12645 [Algoriphagus ratkowskyi]
MDKDEFEKSFQNKIGANFNDRAKYYEINLEVFCELRTLLFEINNCLLLNFDRAAITLTNHLLERLLKLALINSEIGIGSIETNKWNEVFQEPHKKYGTISLANSIELCKKFELITGEEKNYLFDRIRILMRNGFSHADSSNILAHLPDDLKMIQGNFSNPNEKKEISVNQKIIPFLQALQMESFATQTSKPYFDYVYDLIFRIENRLIEKSKNV